MRVFEVELVAATAGEVSEVIEFHSVGFAVMLAVRAWVVDSPDAAEPTPDVRVFE